MARTARSQLETGCGPRAAAEAGAAAVTAAIPTDAVARATIVPIRRLLFIPFLQRPFGHPRDRESRSGQNGH
ncbi:hypothetical protein Ato02nite_063650 [Paractinoplanes toevensis]|uniref:Uncharacterized protein n=1 Tax=Paractinoplanes toevensis TaxID=571911 RepID=A0A919TG74_9ACTN|nr:hypothetical protein Ato02nite_063650 [Actinoplanes toevensis]